MADDVRTPRPTPGGRSTAAEPSAEPTPPPRGLVRIDAVQPSQLVATAGGAVVTAARVGRLFGRTGWRLARQLPGGAAIEREAQRAQRTAVREARRWLGVSQQYVPQLPGVGHAPPLDPEEQRAITLIQAGEPGDAPLRSAMEELLERSVNSTDISSRDYLFGTIMSQLVPDEARIIAALASGRSFAAIDVVQRRRRQADRTLLANASTVGRAAGVATLESVPTYLDRLRGFGLVDFGAAEDSLASQYQLVGDDPLVQEARATVPANRQNSVKIVRKSLRLSPLGKEFWTASDPVRPRPRPR